MTRLFYTTGKQDIIHDVWDKPDIKDDEIEVQSVFVGMCRSDIDMYCGTFQLLPKTIQGHESVGIVSKVGANISDVVVGDYVATRGEPGFADYYNCPEKMYVKIPELLPKYIIEPVACAINIAYSSGKIDEDNKVLILGSGFLSTMVFTYLNIKNNLTKGQISVVGNSNKEFWNSQPNANLISADQINDQFNTVIDISEKAEYLDLNIYAERANIILAAEKHPPANITFGQLLWKAVTITCPSPRTTSFYNCMLEAVELIENGSINVDTLWTKSYNRETEVELAFTEGLNRKPGYGRGYIEWQNK